MSAADYILQGSPALAFAGSVSSPIVHLTRQPVTESDLRILHQAWGSRKLTATTATVTVDGGPTLTVGAILEEFLR